MIDPTLRPAPPPFRLVPISAEGDPAEPLLLSELAAQVCDSNAAYLVTVGYQPPWIAYLAVSDDDSVLGTCSFKGPPDANGAVELAYFTFEENEGQGIGGAMAAALVAIAEAESNRLLVAHTLPEENASVRILIRLGFVHAGDADDEEVGRVWRWIRSPNTH